MVARVLPLVFDGGSDSLSGAERSQLVAMLDHCDAMGDEWVRRQVIDNNRIDIFGTYVLGYRFKPFHLRMLQWQFQHPNNLQLAFRGAGKSTSCTITKILHLLAKNRDLRIVIASKTSGNSESFLKEIKGHLEGNARLIKIFGEFYDPRRVGKWDNTEIEVLGRTRQSKEASVTCIGVQGAVVSKHYDVEFSDDLIDEENSRTKHMRDKVKTWYYQTFDPCIEPPDPSVPHRGERHRLGTRYHFDDLYNHWIDNELKGHVQIIPAIDDDGRTPWPEKYPIEWFENKKINSGTIVFGAQYQCNTEAMKGEVFRYDDCQQIDESEVPRKLFRFLGADLAISEAETADHFGIVDIGVDPKTGNIYVDDAFEGQVRFSHQTKLILEHYKKYRAMRAGIETNGYQKAQLQALQDKKAGIIIKPIPTDKDKMIRAWKLSPLFEARKVFFVRKGGRLSPALSALIDQLVMFPGHRYKDLFDALDLAVTASKMRGRKTREGKFGII